MIPPSAYPCDGEMARGGAFRWPTLSLGKKKLSPEKRGFRCVARFLAQRGRLFLTSPGGDRTYGKSLRALRSYIVDYSADSHGVRSRRPRNLYIVNLLSHIANVLRPCTAPEYPVHGEFRHRGRTQRFAFACPEMVPLLCSTRAGCLLHRRRDAFDTNKKPDLGRIRVNPR